MQRVGWTILLAASLAAGGAQAQAGGLVSHRAVYELSLKSAEGAHAPAAARGLIVYDFQGSTCEGWTTTFRQVTDVTPSEGQTRRSDMTSTAFEEPDFSTMRFRVETREGDASKLVQGSAQRSDGGLSIALTQPMRQKVDLGDEPRFPTHQMLGVLEAAEAGRTTYEVKLFDGSDSGSKIYDTTTVIARRAGDGGARAGRRVEGAASLADHDELFRAGHGRPRAGLYAVI